MSVINTGKNTAVDATPYFNFNEISPTAFKTCWIRDETFVNHGQLSVGKTIGTDSDEINNLFIREVFSEKEVSIRGEVEGVMVLGFGASGGNEFWIPAPSPKRLTLPIKFRKAWIGITMHDAVPSRIALPKPFILKDWKDLRIGK